jgi:hypothetical protein
MTHHASSSSRNADSILEPEREIAELEAQLTPTQRLEYHESIAQGEDRFDALTAILKVR